jgi:hypothetical protein
VLAYLVMVIGIPVYFHYCGGELEEISYIVKSNGCCGDESDEDESGCCKNEDVHLQYAADFTFKQVNTADIILPSATLPSLSLDLFSDRAVPINNAKFHTGHPPSPPGDILIQISVLRV